MAHPIPTERIDAVRRFSRFYTRRIGVLRRRLYGSPFSLAESRVLYELGAGDSPTATELGTALDLDAGYLSRMLSGFEKRGLVIRRRSEIDARRNVLALTAEGRGAFDRLEQGSREEVGVLLERVPAGARDRLAQSMREVESILGSETADLGSTILRQHRPGDIGWVIERHAALYAREYGWDGSFEALVAEIAAKFLRTLDPARERCWIAERGGERIGCVFLVRESDDVARLRLLLVEPAARGAGHRQAAGPGMHRFREAGRLWQHHAVDKRRPHGGPQAVCGGWIPAHRRGAPSQLRQGSRRSGLDAGFLRAECTRTHQPHLSFPRGRESRGHVVEAGAAVNTGFPPSRE